MYGIGFKENIVMRIIGFKTLCLFQSDDKFLLSEGYDPAKDEHYLRPIGGSIEFGETSEQAIKREVLEEISAEIDSLKLLKVYENHFTFNDEQGHEVVFIYQAKFTNLTFYTQTTLCGHETDGSTFIAKWYTKTQLLQRQYPIYPLGIEELIRNLE